MNSQIAQAIVRLRWLVLVAFGVCLALAGYFLKDFRVDASADTLLVKNNALYIQTQVANQTFAPQEFILLAYAPKQHALFSEQTFDALNTLSEKISALPRVKQVTSILNVPLIQDAADLSSSTDVSTLDWQHQHYSVEVMKQRIQGHPIFTDLLVNRQGSATALQVVFKPNPTLEKLDAQMTEIQANALKRPLTESEQAQIAQLKAKADPIKQQLDAQRKEEIAQLTKIAATVSDRADTYMGGTYVVGQHLVDIIQSDLANFGIAIIGVIAVLLLALYRTLRWVIFPLFACAVSVVMTMGLFGLLDMRTTVISANFIALQLILTLAVMIHLIGCYREISRDNPDWDQQRRIAATLEDKLAPCFYATLTTCVGFGSLIFSGLQPVMDFGWMMLASMLVTMAVSLLLFPSLLSLFKAQRENEERRLFTGILRVARQVSLTRATSVVLVTVAGFAVMALGISKLNVENSFIDYFADDTQVHKELAFIDKQFGGSTPLDIIINIDPASQKQDLVLSADAVARLQLVQAAVKAFDATGSVTSLVNFTELARQLNHGKPLTEYELTSIYYLLDKAVVNQLVGAYFSPQSEQLRLAVRVQDTTSGLDRQQFLTQLNGDLQSIGLKQQDYQLTNLFVLYQDILSRLFSSQITTLGLVYAVLAVVLWGIFRSVKVALIALVPNVLTTLGILGVIGWAGIPLDIMTITIAAIAMGIAVDDTIHFVHAYLASAQQGKEAACEKAFGHTGLAILFTSSLISVGFSLFGFSQFLPSVYFGLLTATAMIMALVTDLTLLPALLNTFTGKVPKKA